jgi:hypothetical protein
MSAPAILAISIVCATLGTVLYVYVLAMTNRMHMVNLEPPAAIPNIVMR